MNHVTNTFNNIPKSNQIHSPKEVFFGKTFNFQFHEFGAPVVFLANTQNTSKLDPKGISGIFLGIDLNSKGFRIYSGGRVRIERHVKFLSDISDTNSNISTENSVDEIVDSVPNNTSITQPEPRRSERLRNKQSHNASHKTYEPTTYNQAMKCPEKDKWVVAMQEEMRSLEDNNTWTLVDPPKERNTIGSKWVFKIKNNQQNEPTRYKARLVAQGFTQQYGVDYDEVFAPVARKRNHKH